MNKKLIRLTESDLHKIVKESVNRILNESSKGVDPNNVVPEDVAMKYGFQREYGGFENGLELWSKITKNPMNADKYLGYLGIKRFTGQDNNGKLTITVKPNQRINDRMQIPRKIGDYVNSDYADNKGFIFNNPKNGHTRRLNNRGEFK